MNTDINKLYSAEKLIEVFPKYVYMIIPSEWIKTYYTILINLADYGFDMIQSCSASCKEQNKKIIDCFNMFYAAVAAKQLGQDSKANLLIKYVNTQLKVTDNTVIPNIVIPISSDGNIKAIADTINFKFYETEENIERNEDFFVQSFTKNDKIINE